jgi:hypothetical protein
MDQGYRMLGFVVIVILYAVIGLMAAAGTIFIARKILAPKAEQIFYAMLLIMIAAFYLTFAAYFGVASAWRMETAVVVAFVATALPGASLPFARYWGIPCTVCGICCMNFRRMEPTPRSSRASSPRSHSPTEFFCAAFDFCLAAYFYPRRAEWVAAWKAGRRSR